MAVDVAYSLVVMTFERPRALARCLDSIRRLDRPEGGFEVVVVDDGSERKPSPPLDRAHPDLDLRYEWIPHQGVAAARNEGARLARGSFVAFIADDYTLPADYLVAAEGLLDRYPHAGVVTFNVRSVGPSPARHVQQLYHDLVLLQNAGADPDPNGVIETTTLPASRAAVFRRETLERVGPFDERLKVGEDGDMGQRLAELGIPLLFVPDLYVDHHEEKGFLDFLRQRRQYATSYHRLSRTRRPVGSRPRWTLRRCARAVFDKMAAWVPVSRRTGRFGKFCLLAPGLVLFLSRFYLTLRALDRAESAAERAPLERVRRGLNAMTRPALTRRPTMALMEALCRAAAATLRAGGLVSAVFARGSYATGSFRPFLSDIDFAMLVPSSSRDPWETCRALHRRLRLARTIQPFARDRWQTILPESQWGLLERYGYLFGVDDWRPIAGELPGSGSGVTDERLLLGAWWNRQHVWTLQAQRQAQTGATGLRELPASLKKARSFRTAIGERTGARPADEAPLGLGRAIGELEESARELEAALAPDPATWMDAADLPGGSREAEERALSVLSETIDLERDVRAVVAAEGFVHLVIGRDVQPCGWAPALARAYAESGVLTVVYGETALSFAHLLGPRRILDAREGARLPEWPRLLEEQRLYEALYQATHLWVTAGAPDPAEALAPHVDRAAELCAYFLTGEPRRVPPPLPEGLAELRTLDERLAARLPPTPAEAPDARELFALGSALTERLAELLESGVPSSRRSPATTAS